MAELENLTKLPYSYEAVRAVVRVFICEYFRTGRETVTSARFGGNGVRECPLDPVCICFHPQNDTVHDCGHDIGIFHPLNPSHRARARKILARFGWTIIKR